MMANVGREQACEVSVSEKSVDVWQQRIASPDGVSDAAGGRLPEQPGFPPGGLQMRMTTEERVVRPQLHRRTQQGTIGTTGMRALLSCTQSACGV